MDDKATLPLGGEIIAALETHEGGDLQRHSFAPGKIVRLDPQYCDTFALNPRANKIFDHSANADLINSIRDQGQQVPAIVRESPAVGRYELIAGTRRLAAIRYISLIEPGITLLAEVRHLSDKKAWVLAEAENKDRKDISEYEKAQNWSNAVNALFAGNQSALARDLNVDKARITHAITLANLPPEIVELVANPAQLRFRFAEQIGPLLNDREKRQSVLAHAKSLVENGQKFTPAELIRQLTMPAGQADEFLPKKIAVGDKANLVTWHRKENEAVQLTLKKMPAGVSQEDLKKLYKDLCERLKLHIGVR